MKPILARTERIIYDADILRRQPKRVEVSSGAGIGAYFKKTPRCLACGRDLGAGGPGGSPARGKYCLECVTGGRREADQRRIGAALKDVEECLAALKAKCAACRGYDDDTPCVQQDCEATYEKIEANRRRRSLIDSLDGSEDQVGSVSS